MNQEKIGLFIAELRKEKNMTQKELADKLLVTDRCISKWERGKGLPDASLMINLSNILDITVNELLSGEKISNKKYNQKAEENLTILKDELDRTSKYVFIGEIIMIITGIIFVLVSAYIYKETNINDVIKNTLLILSIINIIVIIIYAMNIEYKVGYYECKECHYKYKPSFKEHFFANHIGNSKKLQCPHCHKKIWHKKIYTK